MSCNEIIKAILTPRTNGFRELGWKLRKTLNSADVIVLLSSGEGRPVIVSVAFTELALTTHHSRLTIMFNGLQVFH